VRITYGGAARNLPNIDPITRAILMGLLHAGAIKDVNNVNVRAAATAAGMTVEEKRSDEPVTFGNKERPAATPSRPVREHRDVQPFVERHRFVAALFFHGHPRRCRCGAHVHVVQSLMAPACNQPHQDRARDRIDVGKFLAAPPYVMRTHSMFRRRELAQQLPELLASTRYGCTCS